MFPVHHATIAANERFLGDQKTLIGKFIRRSENQSGG
jgi:hypothetical protein